MKHVLVSGGSNGIGFATAKRFKQLGYSVTIIGKTPGNVANAISVLDVSGYVCDLTDPNLAENTIDTIERERGPIDILVNCAGAAKKAVTLELSHNDWMHSFQNKFFTYTNVLDVVLKRMATRGTGSVVNVIGMGGKSQIANHLNGGAANAALMLVTTGLAQAYANLGIRVNGVNPAGVETDHIKKYIQQDADWNNITFEESKAQMVSKYPMKRLVSPEEVANTVVFVASDEAKSICGAIIPIEGARNPLI